LWPFVKLTDPLSLYQPQFEDAVLKWGDWGGGREGANQQSFPNQQCFFGRWKKISNSPPPPQGRGKSLKMAPLSNPPPHPLRKHPYYAQAPRGMFRAVTCSKREACVREVGGGAWGCMGPPRTKQHVWVTRSVCPHFFPI